MPLCILNIVTPVHDILVMQPRLIRLWRSILSLCLPSFGRVFSASQNTRNFFTFVNTTAIAEGQKIARSLMISVLCNSSRVYKRQKITSTPIPRLTKAYVTLPGWVVPPLDTREQVVENFSTLHPEKFLRHLYYQVSHMETNASQGHSMGGSIARRHSAVSGVREKGLPGRLHSRES